MTGTPAPAPAPNPAPAPAPAPAPVAFDWAQQGLDTDTLGYVTTKGFKAPGDVVGAYRNLEKLHGVPADRLLKIPGPDAKPEEIAAYRERLGAPKTAAEYQLAKFDEVFGENKEGAAKFDGFLRGAFHKLGMPASMAGEFSKEWAAFVATGVAEEAKAAEQAELADQTQFKSGLGDKYEKYVNVANQAAAAFGLQQQQVDALSKVLGFSGTMKFLNAIGSKLGESEYHGGDTRGTSGPDAAVAEINSLKQDASFANRLVNKDAEATAKWNRLHQIAYPGMQQVA